VVYWERTASFIQTTRAMSLWLSPRPTLPSSPPSSPSSSSKLLAAGPASCFLRGGRLEGLEGGRGGAGWAYDGGSQRLFRQSKWTLWILVPYLVV
jgi:hypothetical protein